MNAPLKIGLIGLDTSHSLAFAQILQDQDYEFHLPGAQVAGIFAGGSRLFSLSRNRVQGFTEKLHNDYHLPIYNHLDELAGDMDALMLLSSDGRQHLEQFSQIACGKPVFIDKPLATSTGEASQILSLAAKTGTPLFSCSSLRYATGLAEPLAVSEELLSCESFGPAVVYPDYPGLFWYGVHGIDLLFSWMGAGCQKVSCFSHSDMDVVIGEWLDGRLGIFRGTRYEKNVFGCLLHTNERVEYRQALDMPPFYYLLLKKVLVFFQTGRPPIPLQEVYEVIAFIEAAHQSIQQGGLPVQVQPLDMAVVQSGKP